MKRKRILSVMMTMAMAAGTLGAGAGALNVEASENQEITLMASQNWIKDVDNELFDKFEKRQESRLR